jgi:dTDP-4-dehydrorhamnose 3,5-epimerase-like enzyme
MFFEIESRTDARGSLFPCELRDFSTKRMFFIKDVPAGMFRGEHAHKETDQFLFCISGNIEITFFDGKNETTFSLKEGNYVFEKRMTWTTMKFVESKSILLVLSNKEYDPNDYIRIKSDYFNLSST